LAVYQQAEVAEYMVVVVTVLGIVALEDADENLIQSSTNFDTLNKQLIETFA
jgi:hypothetical protein